MIKKTIKAIFKKIGYSVIKNTTYNKLIIHPKTNVDQTSKNNLLHILFSNIKEQGFKPNAIYDIGANKGTWTEECLIFFPNSNYFLFEP